MDQGEAGEVVEYEIQKKHQQGECRERLNGGVRTEIRVILGAVH